MEKHASNTAYCAGWKIKKNITVPVAASVTPLHHVLRPCPAVTGHLADVESWCLEGFPVFLYYLPMEWWLFSDSVLHPATAIGVNRYPSDTVIHSYSRLCIYVMLFDEMYTFYTHLPQHI